MKGFIHIKIQLNVSLKHALLYCAGTSTAAAMQRCAALRPLCRPHGRCAGRSTRGPVVNILRAHE